MCMPSERERAFVEVQIRVLQDSAGPHYRRDAGLRIAQLQRRIAELDAASRDSPGGTAPSGAGPESGGSGRLE